MPLKCLIKKSVVHRFCDLKCADLKNLQAFNACSLYSMFRKVCNFKSKEVTRMNAIVF